VRMLGTSKLKRGGFLARQFSQSLLQQHYNFKANYTFNPYDTTITRHIYRSFMALSKNWFSRSQYKFKFKIVKSEPRTDLPEILGNRTSLLIRYSWWVANSESEGL
jgi:hypothetical protein